MRPFGLLAGASLLIAACASQPEPLTISDVTVNTDLSAVGSRQAVNYWQGLSGDLETAIASQFAGRIDPAGDKVVVTVDNLSLNSPFTAGATAETARLSGRVEVFNPAGTSDGAYNVVATSQDVADFLPSGTSVTSVPPTSTAYYQAIVQAFARGAATAIETGSAGS